MVVVNLMDVSIGAGILIAAFFVYKLVNVKIIVKWQNSKKKFPKFGQMGNFDNRPDLRKSKIRDVNIRTTVVHKYFYGKENSEKDADSQLPHSTDSD